MEWSLFLFILMGSFSTCRLYEFHFLKEPKTWREAQTFCRHNYTDLATVKNMKDVERLRKAANYTGEGWIGLEAEHGESNTRWLWSLPTMEFTDSKTYWAHSYPKEDLNCVAAKVSKPRSVPPTWENMQCYSKNHFACYDHQSEKIYFFSEPMTWADAQNHCRGIHSNLISGIEQIDETSNIFNLYCSGLCWIGLFRDNWWWSDGNNSSFRNWDKGQPDEDKDTCATMLSTTGNWKAENCEQSQSFFCYDDKVILIQENKTWSEALNYCRKNHHDLVSITDSSQQTWVQARAKKATTPFVWLGLRYTCTLDFWFWVNDKVVCYEKWSSKDQMEDCNRAGAMETGGDHLWFKKSETQEFNFICVK